MSTTATLPQPGDIRVIIKTALDDDALQAYIDDATLMVSPCVLSYLPDRQAAIIKWTAAHLIASSPGNGGQTLASKRLGDAAESYVNAAAGEALKATNFGRQALSLDTNGCLLSLASKPVIFKLL